MSSRTWRATPLEGLRPPFGAAYDPASGQGVDLAVHGYVESEHLLGGTAGDWRSGEPGAPSRGGAAVPYRTRLLVRRPIDPRRESGIVHVEPLHPHMDAGLSWEALGEHMIRRGDAWVGVTIHPHIAGQMRELLDPQRYGALLVPGRGTEWDILSDALDAIRHGAVEGLRSTRIVLSGRSATGSFCRVFARERFATARGGLADAVAIFISSGGAGEAGYPRLSPGDRTIDDDDPRRTVRDCGIPVFEILSETESETHRDQLREDSDSPGDVYRLFQIAGSAHIEDWPGAGSTNATALAAAGLDTGTFGVVEPRSDARSDLISRALMDQLVGVLDGGVAVRAPRFVYDQSAEEPGRMLRRDADGNALGGIRSPWVEAPLAGYRPHGTALPAPDGATGPDWTPLADRALAAGLVGTMRAFTDAEVTGRYGDESDYRQRFVQATARLVAAGLLLAEDADELDATASQRWRVARGGRPS